MKKILFVLPFSPKIGLGHLYRCSVFSEKFKKRKFKTILFKENKNKPTIQNKKLIKDFNFDIILNRNKYKSLILTLKKLNPDYLVIDSPYITKKLRIKLVEKKVKWLEFANGKNNLKLPTQVISTIPNTKKILSYNTKTKYYYGHEYSFLRKEFLKKINLNELSHKKKKIFLCFGGGSDKGLYKYVLKTIFNFPYLFKEINIVCLDENVKKKLNFFKNNLEKTKKKVLKIYFNPPQFVNLIDQSNLIIVTGGGITHEINARRKKMNIISIAKNQILQSKKWRKFGHNYLGNFDKKNINTLEKKIIKILKEKKNIYINKNLFKDKTIEIINDAIKIIK